MEFRHSVRSYTSRKVEEEKLEKVLEAVRLTPSRHNEQNIRVIVVRDAAVKKEIATYQERADYLIKSGSQSPAVMDRWVLKIQGLEEKKRHYEQVLRRELDGLDDEFSTLKFLSQELQMRSRSIRFQKAA